MGSAARMLISQTEAEIVDTANISSAIILAFRGKKMLASKIKLDVPDAKTYKGG